MWGPVRITEVLSILQERSIAIQREQKHNEEGKAAKTVRNLTERRGGSNTDATWTTKEYIEYGFALIIKLSFERSCSQQSMKLRISRKGTSGN